MSMHRFWPILVVSALLGGCSGVPVPYTAQLKTNARIYASIGRGEARSDLEARLGPPVRQDPDGACYWETRYDALNYAGVTVWFDAQGRARRIEVTRQSGTDAPGFQAQERYTREK